MILIGNIFIKMTIKNTKIKMSRNEKGQTLLFVIVAVTIAMTIGVAVSTRTIQSLKRVARTDTSARVIAAAEGGIENLLGRNYSQLNGALYDGSDSVNCESIGAVPGPEKGTCSYVFSSIDSEESTSECTCVCNYCANESDGCSEVMGVSTTNGDQPEVKPASSKLVPGDVGSCGQFQLSCHSTIDCNNQANISWCNSVGGSVQKTCGEPTPPAHKEGDLISSRAVVKVEKFSKNEENDGYSFNLSPGSIKEINLDTYGSSDIRICWVDEPTVIYYYSYDRNGEVRKGGIYADDDAPNVPGISDIFERAQGPYSGYNYCKEIQLVSSSSYGLRIKTLYEESKVAVFPSSGHLLPLQGYKFTSRGEIVTGSGSEERATVIVHKSLPYAPDIFDYGIYTPTTLSGSN